MTAPTKVQILRAMHAFAALGTPINGARLCPDGSVLLLTTAPTGALSDAPEEFGDWVDLAGTQDIHRAQRA